MAFMVFSTLTPSLPSNSPISLSHAKKLQKTQTNPRARPYYSCCFALRKRSLAQQLHSFSGQTQMDIEEQDHPDTDFEETFSEQFVHADSPDSSDIFGEPELFPRVGNEYQAAIPALLTPSERLNYFSNPCDSQPLTNPSHAFLIGLPVPIKLAKTIRDEGIGDHDNIGCSKIEPDQCDTERSAASDKTEPSLKGDCVIQRCVANGYDIVPGLPGDSWSEFAVDCFLLGLYFFGKNLLQVKRFMWGKEMGQILSFYYGQFYRSAKYQRWADCRKTKGRKCIIGQRLLTGSRQHELLSRLLPHLSEASRNTSVEAYKAFMEGSTSLEEYVSTLKSMVGIHVLVEAVGIGKEKGDLTAMAMESSRSNHTFPSRREMPSGKACSALTYEEIVKYLTGDFRLSKARSGDLFWEAVWPRLLAKGWHSEKPNDEAYRGFKNPLVFLLPGIKKYRRKLLKGDHYFDSVSDVLKKVASEPELLVLESEENGARTSGKENGSGSEPTSDEDGSPDPEHPCYLKPRSTSDSANHMKLTIVDTSLLHEDEPSRVRELRTLPAEMKTSSAFVREPRPKNLITFNHSEGQSSLYDHLAADKLSKSVKHDAEHALKRRRIKGCSKADKKPATRRYPEASALRRNNFVLSLPASSAKAARARARAHAHAHARSRNIVLPMNSLAVDCHREKSHKGEPVQGSCSSATTSESHHQSHLLIDLNVPQVPAEPEANEQAMDVKVEEGDSLSQNGSIDTNVHLEGSEQVIGPTNNDAYQDELADGNTRRHSTRIRPLSTRALEALETSFCSPKQGKKRHQAMDTLDEKTKVARRARTKASTSAGNCTIDAVKDSDSMRSDQIHSPATEVLRDALT